MAGSSSDHLVVTVVDRGEAVEVALTGELDLSTVEQLRSALCAVANGPRPTVSVDLGLVTFADSSGLRVLAERWLGASGKQCVLTDVSLPVRRSIEASGLAELFGIDHHDPAGALVAARDDLERARERNRAAARDGEHPPVGIGAMSVLERRVAAAERRVGRDLSSGAERSNRVGSGMPSP